VRPRIHRALVVLDGGRAVAAGLCDEAEVVPRGSAHLRRGRPVERLSRQRLGAIEIVSAQRREAALGEYAARIIVRLRHRGREQQQQDRCTHCRPGVSLGRWGRR